MQNSESVIPIELQKDDILCVEGEENFDLFLVKSGQLIVCVNKGSQITPLAYLGPGEFLGELSFFDKQPRSAHVISTTKTVLLKIPIEKADEFFTIWLLILAQYMTMRIRNADEIIRHCGIKKHLSNNSEVVKGLTIQEQTHYFKLLKSRGVSA